MSQTDFGKTTGGVKLYQDPSDPTKATATPPPTDPIVQPDQGATQNPVIRYPVSPNVADNYSAPKSFDQFTQDQNKYVSPVDEMAIRENIRKAQQARIDAINATYDTMVQKENVAGQDRLGSERAVEARGGLVGSDFGAAQKAKVVDYNSQSVNAINKQRDLEVQGVYDKIDQLTADRVKAQKEEALGKANAYIDYIGKAQTTARDAIKSAGKAGVTLDQLKSQGAEKLKQLLDSTGYSEFELGMQLEANKPDPIKYDWTNVGDSIVGIGVDPKTGMPVKTVYSAKDLGIPSAANLEFQTLSDGVYFYDKNNPTRDAAGNIILKKAGMPEEKHSPAYLEYQDAVKSGYKGSFNQYQTEDANRKAARSTTVNNYGGAGIPSGVTSGTGNPIADSWVQNIKNGSAKLSDVPATLKNLVSSGLAQPDGKISELKQNALDSANELLTKFKSGNKFAVGGSSYLGQFAPAGSATRDFITQFDNLKALLSLDNVKLLKGQGAVSDSERKILEQASTKLSTAQSEDEFQKTLENVVSSLSGQGRPSAAASSFSVQTPDGKVHTFPDQSSLDSFKKAAGL